MYIQVRPGPYTSTQINTVTHLDNFRNYHAISLNCFFWGVEAWIFRKSFSIKVQSNVNKFSIERVIFNKKWLTTDLYIEVMNIIARKYIMKQNNRWVTFVNKMALGTNKFHTIKFNVILIYSASRFFFTL